MRKPREHQIPRQTLYRWKARAERALRAVFCPVARPNDTGGRIATGGFDRYIVEGPSLYRGIQTCIKELLGEDISPAKISAIINAAGKTAEEAPTAIQQEIHRLYKHVQLALPRQAPVGPRS